MPDVAGEVKSIDTDNPLQVLEGKTEIIKLQYPLGSGDNIPLPKYLMTLFIYQQSKDKEVREVAVSSGLDADRYSKIAGVRDVINVRSGTGLAIAGGLSGALLAAATKGAIFEGVTRGGAGLAAIKAAKIDPNRKTIKRPLSYISLYMPETLTFTDQQNFQPLSLTDATGIAGLISQAPFLGAEQQARLGEFAGLFGNGFSEAAVFNLGYGLNPQLILLYKGPTHRQFVFQFKFVPRNEAEGKEILNIIRTLRYHATPNFGVESLTSRYVVPPSEFEIEFYVREDVRKSTPEGEETIEERLTPNQKLPRLGQCVLTNVDVNYAPSGHYSAHKDGMPTEIQVQLTFTETILLSKQDILKLGY